MARILLVTSGLRGLLNASFEVARRLTADGHQVLYASPAPVGDAVRARGIDYHQLPEQSLGPAPAAHRVGGPLAGPRSRLVEWTTAAARRRAGIEALRMGEVDAFLREQRPDLVLLDAELYEHAFTAHALGLRLALITPFFATARRPGLPPLHTALTPDAGRLAIEKAWLRARLSRFGQARITSLRYAFTERRSLLRRYARERGFPLRWLAQYDFVTLFTHRHLPLLSLTAAETDFPHPRPANLHYVGPMVADDRDEDADTDAALGKALRAGGRLIYCGATTMGHGPSPFVERVIETVARRPDWQLIVALGPDAARRTSPAPNVHLFDRVPQLRVLRRADACITHGGVNTLNECLALEVPMLLRSGGNYDQDGVCARVAWHGLGLAAGNGSDLEQRLERLMDDGALRDRLRALRANVERYRTERVLERRVADYLT